MDSIRVYTKEPGKSPSQDPVVLQKNSTIKDVCLKLHKDFLTKFKFSRIWGDSVKHPGQKILKTEHILKDKDILEIHLK